MKVEPRQKIERTVACEVIKGLLADDFKTSVFDGEQTTLKHSTDVVAIEAAVLIIDEDQLRVEHRHVVEKGWVLFIYGNGGHDVIANHTTNLELSLKSASELVDKIAGEDPVTSARVLAEVGA